MMDVMSAAVCQCLSQQFELITVNLTVISIGTGTTKGNEYGNCLVRIVKLCGCRRNLQYSCLDSLLHGLIFVSCRAAYNSA